MKSLLFIRPLTLALFCFLGQGVLHAQVPDWQLREHIVHDTEGGQDVWRDDRITMIPDTTICYLYVGRKQSGPLWVRLQVRYAGYRALNMTKIKFSKGDKAVEFTPMPDLLHHGNNGMMQWEWYDSTPGENEVKVILAIIEEPGVKLTMIGRERTLERELTETERIAMANMVQQARVLGRVN